MATLSLKISLDSGKVVKTMQFDPATTVYDACRIIREKILEANMGEPKDYGLFLTSDEDSKKGIWLEPARTLEHYILRNGDLLEFNRKLRNLRVRMLDGSVKTLLVDDSQIVANLMVVICTRIGITNYDEYSLVREEPRDEQDSFENKPNFGTLTLRRKNQEKERDAKMEQLRKKLRTDDEVNWVDPALTLREQGIDVTETLLLRRKFFFSDRNVDSRDPVQLGLLYVQARDAILDGTHPVTQDMACEFAGIQCQIQFGDHKDEKHIAGFLDPKEFLPASYAKVKGIEKKIFKEHRSHIGLSDLDSKVLYTKNARALPTYGVAFFLVKEKMKGKNKLVPRLLGVSKDSVLRLDEKTKDILQTWPLTTVRRWCGSANTFTLDFGDYSDQYYSVQTTEADQILQVIAGYIDIILKKQKAKEHFGIEGDEGSTMFEDSVSPSKAQILQHESTKLSRVVPESVALPAVVRPGGDGSKSFVVSHTSGAQQTTTSGQITIGHTPPATNQSVQVRTTTVLTEPQRALLSTISSGREIIRETESHLIRATLPPELGHDTASLRWKEVQLDTNKQVVTSHIAAMNAATAQVVTLTSGPTEEVDHTAVGAAITTITSNLPEMTKGVQMIAALMEDTDNGDKLLDATRKLCTAFSDLLKAAEPEAKETRQNLLNAASRVGEASTKVLYTIGEETEENKEIQDILLALAKAVANTTAALVLKAKNVAATCKNDQQAQNRVITAATQCALATSQLVACAKVVAPTLHNPACREQLTSAARAVAQAVESLLAECRAVGAEGELTAAAAEVSAALREMLEHVNYDRRAHPTTVQETSVETVMTASDRLITSQGDSAEMVKQARLLGQATAQLITNIKTEAEHNQQSEQQRRLLAAAKLLADATARMVEAARQCASSPQDRTKQEALRKAAEELRYITVDYAQGQDLVGTQISRLQDAARQATSSATQLVTSAHSARTYNTNKHSQEVLMQECKILSDLAPQLVEGVKVSNMRPGQASAQLELITASESFLQPSGHVAQAARAVLPTVTDAASAKQLGDTTHQFTASCTELRAAVNRARLSCKGLELDAAAEVIRSLQKELDEVEEAARAFDLKPLPGETPEWASQSLANASRNTASSVAQLVSSLRHNDAAGGGRACGDTAHSLREFVGSVRAVAAADSEPRNRERVIDSGRQVLTSSLLLVETAKKYLTTSERIDTTTIVSIAKNISQRLEQTVEAVPSHKELDIAMENINETLSILSMGEFPPSDRSYGDLQQELNSAAEGLNAASSEVVQTVERPAALADSSRGFGDAFDRLLGVSMEMCGQTEDDETRSHMLTSMRGVTVTSSRLLGTAKSVSQDLTQPNARNRLAAAARAVTDSINNLVDVCTNAAPGQKECDKAVRSIQSTVPLLSSPSQPVNDLGYFGCLDAIVDQSKTLSEGMSGMANSAKRSDHDQFSRSVRSVADAICGLVECTAQSAYLVAVSDETSVAGRAGLVDQAQFARAAQAIQHACEVLSNPNSNQQQVLSAATVIAKHTSALCNACRVASGKTPNPQAKRHFVQAAKDVANSTAALVKEIKALDNDYSEANRSRCAQATGPLLDAVHSLCQFANSPEFASVPAKISPQARRSQEAILESGRMIIKGSCSMVESAKVLAVQPTDKPQWQSLATHSKTVSDSIKALVNNIRDKAPGQRECLAALETLNSQLRELDQASLQSVQQNFEPRKSNTLQGFSEQIESSATEILERLEPLRTAARSEAENLGHTVVQLVSYVEPLVQAGIGAASNITESSPQLSVLEQCKTVVEGVTQLVLASKDAGGNPRATSIHPDVDEQTRNCREAVNELTASVRGLCTQHGLVGGLLDSVSRSTARITSHRMSLVGYDETDSFVDYQTRMVGVAKEIARLATDMTGKAATDASRLAPLAGELAQKYGLLAQDSVGAAATTTNTDVAHRIRTTVVDCGDAVTLLIKSAGQCQLSADSAARRSVADNSKLLNEKVGSVLAALQAGSRGTQACIDAAATVSAIIGDLDTTILFASAGTLHAENESDTFSERRESILKTAKTLVEDTKTLVGGAAGSQEQLADAAQCSVNTIVQLAEIVKLGAMSLGSNNPDSQVLLIHAVRDVAAALRDLIHTTKDASGKHITHPHMIRLKDSAKHLGQATKRWSLPTPKANTLPRQRRRRSANFARGNEYYSCDSETDLFVSDQEEELIKLLDYSSQDDDISPSVFYDACDDVRNVMRGIRQEGNHYGSLKKEDCYDRASRNSLVDMDWRIVKYGENILIGEIKKLMDVTEELASREVNRNKREKLLRQKAKSDLDNEMKRLSQVIEEMDTVDNVHEISTTTITTIQTNIAKKPRLEEKPQKNKIKNTTFKVKKVRPVNLVINLDVKPNQAEIISVEPLKSPQKPDEIENQKGEATPIIVQPDTVTIENNKSEFWKMFTAEADLWKALAQKNLEKNEETRQELARFSGHELVIGDYQNEINKYEEERNTLQKFIQDVDMSKSVDKTLKYDERYEEIVLKLIEFAKKDFMFKGFDPIISKLKKLSNLQIEPRKKKIVNVTDIHNIYSTIDITNYTYEELCQMEKYYKEIVKKYNRANKENKVPRNERSPSIETDSETNTKPSYHKNVILNIQSTHNTSKNINKYTKSIQNMEENRSHSRNQVQNQEIYDLTRTYPAEYYANNWWSIYEDILKTREQQFGSIDNWWKFYEAILTKDATNEEELKRIRAVVEYRNSLRASSRNSGRMEEQLRMLDEIKRNSFRETEDVRRDEREAQEQSVMVTNVTSLLKTVKAVEDEHTRGTRALESTIEAISQEIRVLLSPTPPRLSSTPEELVRATRQMTGATARAVAAGNSGRQDDITAAANVGRKAVSDVLTVCKGAAYTAETSELRERTLTAGHDAATAYRELLQAVLSGVQGAPAAKQQFPDLSRRVAQCVADIIAAAELLKGSDWVDPDDPTVIAENELLGAAASIDAAANKLAALRPRRSSAKEADETLNFDEMILEAAKSIIAATSALVRAASAAQRELIDQGKVARRPTSSSDDGQWSEGLISAARMVAAAAHSLVEAANALVQGLGSEEKLISSAKQVASSTAHLLVACKVKADPSSESTRRLQVAGAEVIRSTDNLVRAARDAISNEEERCLVLNRRMVGGIAQEIDARSEVLRIEKELEEARGRLTAIRQAKYKLKTGDTSGEETDHDYSYTSQRRDAGYTSDSSGHRFTRPGYSPANASFGPANSSYGPNTTYSPDSSYGQNATHFTQNTTNLTQNTTNLSHHPANIGQNTTNLSQNIHQLNQSIYGTPYGQTDYAKSPVDNQKSSTTTNVEKTTYTQSPSFSSFRPASTDESPKQNYEGFTTRANATSNDRTMQTSMTVRDNGTIETTSVIVTSTTLEEVRSLSEKRLSKPEETERIAYKPEKRPPPPPRRGVVSLQLPTVVTATKTTNDGPVVTTTTKTTNDGPVVMTTTKTTKEGPVVMTTTRTTKEGPVVMTTTRTTKEGPVVMTTTRTTKEGPVVMTTTRTTKEGPVVMATTRTTKEGPVVMATTRTTKEGPVVMATTRTTKEGPVVTATTKVERTAPVVVDATIKDGSSTYETRLYDTPRAPAPPPPTYIKSEENYRSQHYSKDQKQVYDVPKVTSPLSPKFNARYDLKFDQKSPEPLYSTIKKPTTPNDGIRDHFTETRKSTENIPGGKIESEYTVKSESYQSYPKSDFQKLESVSKIHSPYTTSTPTKPDFNEYRNVSDYSKNMTSTDLVKAVTPDFSKERISSPYGYGGPNYTEESSTEVKEIPNGTQRITTTKIYSSSPVTITSTNTKYDSNVKPIKLEGLDELSKSFEHDSRFSTIDSRYDSKYNTMDSKYNTMDSKYNTMDSKYNTMDSKFNTMDSKLSSDTSRSFMRPSDFQQSDYQSSTSVVKVKKPSDLAKELDSVDRKLKQTISKETVERKTVMTSSHKSETSSTVTKKFGNI